MPAAPKLTALGSRTLRHALFVAFHYPPEASSSGVLRTLKYSRYLPKYGWRVSVLTLDPSAYTVCDAQLEKQIPANVRVVRTRYVNTKWHLSVRGIYPGILALPDAWVGWWPWAVVAGRRLLRDDPADIIYSTSPHATAHLIAMRLARKHGLPWVSDFRDPWIEYPPPTGTPTGRLFLSLDRYLERRVIRRSSRSVTSTTHLRDVLRARYPNEPGDKIVAIPNGYDEADFAGPQPASATRSECFTITHAGSINASFRDPRPLLYAIRNAANRGVISLEQLRINFVGGGEFAQSSEMRAALEETGLAHCVRFSERVPYDEALRQLARSDLLLLLQSSEDTVGLVPAKLYEYLRTQKPVLALVWPGATGEILETTGGGWAVDPRDPDALAIAVETAWDAWREDTLRNHCVDLGRLRRFERSALAGELAAIFDSSVAVAASKATRTWKTSLRP